VTLRYDALIVGGGFYGCRIALMLKRMGRSVLLVEREAELMSRASLRNQARVHQGYHYPRSVLTALRSRVNYTRFVDEYADCVDETFAHYYAIGRSLSKTTAPQFAEFCRRIGAPLEAAPAEITRLFDSSRIEGVFSVRECAFDAARLAVRLRRELDEANVDVFVETEAVRAARTGDATAVTLVTRGSERTVTAPLVINATYARLNALLAASGADIIPAKHELTEMALVEPPPDLHGAAVTVMDGPFFSLMPYPSRGLFTLSHVRYTPHVSWLDESAARRDGDTLLHARESAAVHMIRDAQRYLPAMRESRHVESIWEVKTVMPRSEKDDSRPILLRGSEQLPGVITVLGAKIDSVYDVEDALTGFLGAHGREAALAGTLA
jgi:glycine/D-amino acid oxidase-like deaminating enzyme